MLKTDTDIEVLNSKLTLLWSHYVGGVEPSSAATFGSDLAHFDLYGSTFYVWARTGAGNTFSQFAGPTGALLKTHTFTDWGTTSYLLQPVGTELVAYNVTDAGGTYTLSYRVYNGGNLGLIKAGTLTHSDAGGLSMLPLTFGVCNGAVSGDADRVNFFNQGVYTSFGKTFTNPAPGAGEEAWTVAVDAAGGVIQAIVSSPTTAPSIIGGQRLTATGTTSWSSTSFVFPSTTLGPIPQIATTNAAEGSQAIQASGSTISAFDYLTGAQLWSSTIQNPAFTFSGASVGSATGSLVDVEGTAGFALASLYDYVASSAGLAGPSAVNAVVYGVSSATPLSSGGVLANSPGGEFAAVSATGAISWSSPSPTVTGISASPAGDLFAAITGTTVNISTTATGSLVGSYAGSTPVSTAWVSESELAVVNSDGTWQLVSVSGGATALVQSYTSTITGTYAVTSDAHWLVGYGGGSFKVFDLTKTSNTTPVFTAYSAYPTSAGTARFVASKDGRIASLETNASGLQWSVYHVVSTAGATYGEVVKDSVYTYTAPFTPASGAQEVGDISADLTVASYFVSQPTIGTNSVPTSELAFQRLSDGKILSTDDNSLAFVNSVRFSANHAALYAVLGGGESDQGLTAEQTGSQDLLSVNVPTWLSKVSFSSATVSSGTPDTLTVNLASPAGSANQVVALTLTGGATYGTSLTSVNLTIKAGATSGTLSITAPVSDTATTAGVSAVITANPDAPLTASFSVLAPVLNVLTFKPNVVSSGGSTTGTVGFSGAVASARTVTLSDNLSTMTYPATVTVAAGTKTITFPVSTVASTANITTKFTATSGGQTATANLPVTPATVTSVVFDNASPTGGDTVACTVTISAPAPTNGGFSLYLTSGNSALTVPAAVKIPNGSATVTFDVTTSPVASNTPAKITATLGSQTGTATLTIGAPTVVAVNFEQHAVIGGTPALYDVLLSGAAASGTSIALSSTSTRLTVPASVAFTAGSSFETFSFPSTNGADAPVTVTATFNGTTASDTVTVYPQN
jgi:hypothetical protein